MILIKRGWHILLWAGLTAFTGFVTVCAAIYLYLAPTIPPVEVLKDVELQTPLSIYSADGQLMAEIGEQRRTPLQFEEIPELYVKALMAIEDHRFEDHIGVDPMRFGSAALEFITTGRPGSGGSTLTQQVARSFFLNPDKTFTRKFTEIILAFRMEQVLTKAEILELYSNQMYLGHRAYGIQAAAQVYYGRDISELELPELAMLAGLHQRPSGANPLAFPERAMSRRDTVLNRMYNLDFITDTEYQRAIAAPNTAERNSARIAVSAPYVAEQARLEVVRLFGEDAINAGYKVYTSIDARQQDAANRAVVRHLLNYSERHGYVGPEANHELPTEHDREDTELYQRLISQHGFFGGLEPALVIHVEDGQDLAADEDSAAEPTVLPHVLAWGRYSGWIEIPLEGMTWARERRSIDNYGPRISGPSDVLTEGDVIRVRRGDNGNWRLTQIPEAQSGFIAMDPNDGGIKAMVGGFDFFLSRFNRVTQANRQPGSTFKPFVYAAALDAGLSPSTLVNDAPISMQDATLEEVWRPRNSSDRYLGYIPMREALYRSINVASVRLLNDIGVTYASNYVSNFGFDPARLDRNLGMVLGNSSYTPLEVTRGYAAFANGGFRVDPYLVDRIEDPNGNIVYESPRVRACRDCDPETPGLAERILSAQTHYLMVDMLRQGITRGTGTAAQSLGRSDIAGKTGTTNNGADAWFAGFNPNLVAAAWVGRDDNTSLGFNEFGGRAALPIWIDFMSEALAGTPDSPWSRPSGIAQVRIDPESGKLAPPGYNGAVFEVFRSDLVPTESVTGSGNGGASGSGGTGSGDGSNRLF
ncbi:PBP1A family penicillin-binding protein [Natronospirillum operosum]|uniref:Penicillin-binding protein 1A n=1 Tax=Natronospirillum operosum TaxID=2759953 RepID=A0A4Z0W7C5_9GAMM|nr:PBP1A family penicillin-binding protein [Natronospirillum operosum]TGG93277.1 PBP1A family penicillin-binding protein [Natronospirillum operosum]